MEELIYDVYYHDEDGRPRGTQFKIEKQDDVFEEYVSLINLILSAKEELRLKEIISIELQYNDDEDDYNDE